MQELRQDKDFMERVYAKQKRVTFAAIEEMKRRRDTETKKAVRRALERKGGKRGRKKDSDSEWIISTLRNLAKGRPWKDAVPQSAKRTPDTARKVVKKYCLEVVRYGDRFLGVNSPEDWDRPEWAATGYSRVLREVHQDQLRRAFGIDLPRDQAALNEIYRSARRPSSARRTSE